MGKTVDKPASSPKKKQRDPRDTPAMRQYLQFKQQHPDCVLFFRMGDFYEMFDDDAVLCHRELGITLTERSKGIPMAGVPYHAVEGYLRKMIERGHRVAVCEQTQDPREAKGVVDRAVTRVLTPGTLIDETLLDDGAANCIAAICFTETGDESAALLAIVEVSTGSFVLHDLPRGRVVDEVARLSPSELVYVETADGNVPPRVQRIADVTSCALTARPSWTFRQRDAFDALREHFGVNTLNGFGLDDDDEALGPAGALVHYLRETQFGMTQNESDEAVESQPTRLSHLRPPRREEPGRFVTIDATSLRALEIERTMRHNTTEGSLLHALQRCKTPMGKRLLREWLCFPIRELNVIQQRQRSVAALIEDRDCAELLSKHLANVQDVARIAGRLVLGRATPRDLVGLGQSTAEITAILDLLEARPAFAAQHELISALAEQLVPLADEINRSCVDSPPNHMREGGLFEDGIDKTLDESRGLQRDGNAYLANYQKQLADETGIPSLKVGFNKVFGYYIEITHAQKTKVPDTFSRKQTLKNAERYITPELKEFEEKITTADSRAIEREQQLFKALCDRAANLADALGEFADQIASLDVLNCFAENACRFRYVQPRLVDESTIAITQGRHPVLDRFVEHTFVPNDCGLGALVVEGDFWGAGGPRETASEGLDDSGDLDPTQSGATLALITGPNMAGKSTYIRQVALITLLAHTGSFVPADAATIGVVDRIFTRIGANDELHQGQSTFMVEMTETANILHHATDRSLVILDEIGRGTSTLDGLSLAWAIAETMVEIGCLTLFATHYHELTTLADTSDRVRNLHVAVREWGDDIVFLYRILPGRTNRSYGIHVAKIAGLPSATVERANDLLESLAVQTEQSSLEASAESSMRKNSSDGQMSLFMEYVDHPVVESLRDLKLESLSPMQAFDVLRELKGEVGE